VINVIKKYYDDKRNFKYDCICSTFNIERKYIPDLYSYSDTIDYDYSECKKTHVPHKPTNARYGLNSINLRSDELKVVKDGTHILFGGCSQTWGHGINNKEDLWSYIVNQSFSDSSGYFNLARSGWNTSQIVADAIAYCNAYGFPKYMFLLFPDHQREIVSFGVDQDRLMPIDREYIGLLQERSLFLAVMAIEAFCQANGIKLLYSTWHGSTTKLFSRWNLKNFMPLTNFTDELVEPDPFFWTGLQGDGHWAEKHNKRFAEMVLESI
jgi:hypothetical protein